MSGHFTSPLHPKALLVVVASALVFGFVSTAIAQVLPPEARDQLQRSLQREEAAQTQQQLNERQKAREQRQGAGQIEMPDDPLNVPEGGPCFTINRVDIDGVEWFGELPEGHGALIGKCATLADIVRSLNIINAHYKDLGFITTRAYLPKQNVADGTVSITVIPGLIEGYVYADGTQANARIVTAFRGKRGDLLNLRDLEQGLENLSGPRSSKATFKLIPGEKPGGSFI